MSVILLDTHLSIHTSTTTPYTKMQTDIKLAERGEFVNAAPLTDKQTVPKTSTFASLISAITTIRIHLVRAFPRTFKAMQPTQKPVDDEEIAWETPDLFGGNEALIVVKSFDRKKKTLAPQLVSKNSKSDDKDGKLSSASSPNLATNQHQTPFSSDGFQLEAFLHQKELSEAIEEDITLRKATGLILNHLQSLAIEAESDLDIELEADKLFCRLGEDDIPEINDDDEPFSLTRFVHQLNDEIDARADEFRRLRFKAGERVTSPESTNSARLNDNSESDSENEADFQALVQRIEQFDIQTASTNDQPMTLDHLVHKLHEETAVRAEVAKRLQK